MRNDFLKDIEYDSEDMKFYLQEKLILEVTNCISEKMHEKKISKSDLARKLGRTKGYITQLLNGNANMTLRTISDVMWALDSALKVQPASVNIDYSICEKQPYDIRSVMASSKILLNEDKEYKLAS